MENLIKWNKKDYSLLRKEVNKFNRRIKELESFGRKILPEEIKYKDVKENIYSRKEFNRIIKQLEKFQERKSAEIKELESGEKISKWEYDVLKQNKKIAINRLSSDLIQKENENTNIKELNELKGTIKSIENLEKKSGKDFENTKQRLKKIGTSDFELKKAKTFQENFIKAMRNMGRREIVKFAKSFKNPIDFWNTIKDSNLADLDERYDIEKGIIQLSMDSDESYYYELEKLGIEYKRR